MLLQWANLNLDNRSLGRAELDMYDYNIAVRQHVAFQGGFRRFQVYHKHGGDLREKAYASI